MSDETLLGAIAGFFAAIGLVVVVTSVALATSSGKKVVSGSACVEMQSPHAGDGALLLSCRRPGTE